VPVVYDAAKQELVCRDRRNPLPPINGKVRLQVLVDRTSLEIFGNDGLLYMPMAGEFAPGDRSLSLTVTDSALRFSFLEANELKSIWPKKQTRP
jgi:fructan beta-fructosidase